MAHHTCFILPKYLVREYIKDLERCEQENIAVAHIAPLAGHAAPHPRVLILKLLEHLEFERTVVDNIRHRSQVLQQTGDGASLSLSPLVLHSSAHEKPIPEDPDQQVYNMDHKVDARYTEGYVRPSEDKRLPGDSVNSDFDKDTQAVYDNSSTVYKFYANLFQRNSLDNKHMKLNSSIHFGKEYANAFWTDYDSQMVYGDGSPDILTNITTSLDVAGHEMTHGFINKAAGLEYEGESGALNESIADIFGVLTRQWSLKQTFSTADWLVGPGTVPYGAGLRSFKDTPANKYDLQPKNVAKMKEMQKNPRYKEYLAEDYGGVHIFSGVPNHAFYLFAESFGEDSQAYDVPGHVWYETVVSKKVDPNSTFKEFANLTLNIAKKKGNEIEKKLRAAWTTVGVL